MAPKRKVNKTKVLPSSQGASPPSGEKTSSESSTSSTPRSPSTQPPQKRAKTLTDLTMAQEADMASWLEGHELLYNKKLSSYKDLKKKDALWEERAIELHKTAGVLKIWYRSIRTRYTRLLRTLSGGDAAETELTERDRWILRSFGWLRSHVGEARKKNTVSSLHHPDNKSLQMSSRPSLCTWGSLGPWPHEDPFWSASDPAAAGAEGDTDPSDFRSSHQQQPQPRWGSCLVVTCPAH